MDSAAKNKLQRLLTEYLLKEGSLELALPSGMVLELGVTQENRYGEHEITPDYCHVTAHHRGRSVTIDRYNLGLRYKGDGEMVCEQSVLSDDGTNVHIVDVL